MENKSQIERGFDALTNSFINALNPPLADLCQKPLKECLDKAFETLRKRFTGKFGEVFECPDDEMINVIQCALVWYQTITSVDEALSFIRLDLNGVRNGIERVAENQWIIKSVEALKGVSQMLTERYRTLNFQR